MTFEPTYLFLFMILFFVMMFLIAMIPPVIGFMIWMLYERYSDRKKLRKMQDNPIKDIQWNERWDRLSRDKKAHTTMLIFSAAGAAFLVLMMAVIIIWMNTL